MKALERVQLDPKELAKLSEAELTECFVHALAGLAFIAEGATAPMEAVVGRRGYHGSSPQPLTPGSAQLHAGSVLNVMPISDRIARLDHAWQSTTTKAQRRQVAGTAVTLLDLERKGKPKRERYDKSEATRRRIAVMPGSTREVAAQFLDLSHMTVQRLRNKYAPQPPHGTVEERVRDAVSLHSSTKAEDDAGRATSELARGRVIL
jgi:hypothetical protein